MKNAIRQVSTLLADTLKNKRLRGLFLAALVVAMMGAWAHRLYAARSHAEEKLRAQTATLNDVMVKLDTLQAQIDRQSEVMTAKLNSLEYQNARLASLGMGARGARFTTISAAGQNPQARGASPFLSRLPELDADICGAMGVKGGFTYKPKMKLIGKFKGNVGLEAAGNGVEGDLLVQGDKSLEGEVGGDLGLDAKVCWKIPIDTSGLSQDLLNAVRDHGADLATTIQQLYLAHPKLHPDAVAQALQNFDLTWLC
jgi:hypothetical protein